MSEDKYKEFLQKQKRWYGAVKKVYCRHLGADVIFNSEGFAHLIYDSYGRKRSISDSYRRLIIIPLSVQIIGLANSIHEERIEGTTRCWALRRRIDRTWITVVLRKVGDGQITFFSIM